MIISAYSVNKGILRFLKNPSDIKRIDILNYAFGKIAEDFSVDISGLKYVSKISSLKRQNPRLKIVLSIGGWGSGGFSEMAFTLKGRRKFVKSVVEILEKYNFDGIDVDWEYPCSSVAGIESHPDDRVNFTYLISELRDGLNKMEEKMQRHLILSIAAGADESFVNSTQMDIVSEYLDYVNLMTYDLRGSFTNITGHHTNLYSQSGDPDGPSVKKTVELFINAGVPRNKILVGIAFYGRMWEGVPNKNGGLNQKAKTTGFRTCDYTDIVRNYINRKNFKYYWDGKAKAPYLFDGNLFISYEDEKSIEYKMIFVRERDLAGIMFWEYSLDETGNLLKRIYRCSIN